MHAVLCFLRRNLVTVISLLAAGISFAFSPAEAWWKAIDWKTLNLLFCLMIVVAGLRSCNFFRVMAQRLLDGRASYRMLAHALVQMTFFASMAMTNDVALIAFVPFAIYVLNQLQLSHRLPGIIALQTVAANLGSMATPVGNPQNLFLYLRYTLGVGEFFGAMLPITLAAWVLVTVLTHCLRNQPIAITFPYKRTLKRPKMALFYVGLFCACLLTVFRLLPGGWLFGGVMVATLLLARSLLRTIDYGLLLTFVGFFIFSGNLGQMPEVSQMLTQLLQDSTQATALIASQVLSNVPAAILLQPFTPDWSALLYGVNIGGLGTPIASLASLISLNLYLRESTARPGYYLLLFTVLNLALLIPLYAFSFFIKAI